MIYVNVQYAEKRSAEFCKFLVCEYLSRCNASIACWKNDESVFDTRLGENYLYLCDSILVLIHTLR